MYKRWTKFKREFVTHSLLKASSQRASQRDSFNFHRMATSVCCLNLGGSPSLHFFRPLSAGCFLNAMVSIGGKNALWCELNFTRNLVGGAALYQLMHYLHGGSSFDLTRRAMQRVDGGSLVSGSRNPISNVIDAICPLGRDWLDSIYLQLIVGPPDSDERKWISRAFHVWRPVSADRRIFFLDFYGFYW